MRTFGEGVVARVTIGTVEPVDYVQVSALAADVATLRDDVAGNARVARYGNLSTAASVAVVESAVTTAIDDLDELADLDFETTQSYGVVSLPYCVRKEKTMADWKIVEGDENEERRVGAFIDAHAEALGVKFKSYHFHVESDGEVIAGVTAWSMGPDLHVDMLGVEGSHRREGLGSALLAHVEEAGRADCCTTASVDTFSFQAPDFYPRHGYQEIFRYQLTDGTERIYFSKRL